MSDIQNTKIPLPPQNLEAERAVLGGLLVDSSSFDRISFLKPETFYNLKHQVIFEAICYIIDSSNTPDILVLTEKLKERSALEKAGGRAYIASLTSVVPSAENIEYYANIVLDLAIKRSLITISSDIHSGCFQPSRKAVDLLESAQQKLFTITEAGQKATYASPKTLVEEALNKIEERERNPDTLSGIPSGFPTLDSLTNGFQDSDLIIIGARPGIGKTALALSMYAQISIHTDNPVPAAFFSLEMGKEQIMQRLFAIEASISMKSMRNGRLTTSEVARLSDAAANIYEKPAFVVDMPNMKMLDLKALTRQLIRVENVRIIFIDYLGLITSDNPNLQPFDQMAEISRSLKSLARELKIPIVALSQLGREAEGKQPTLANIRGSGAIEQDADIVMFLNRERSEEKNDEIDGIETDLILSKHRNGPTGKIKLVFKGEYTKYTELSNQD